MTDTTNTAAASGAAARLILEASTGIHGEIAEQLAAEWTKIAAKLHDALAAPAQAAEPSQAGEPWYGHEFKELQSGIWHCECGKTVKELPSTPRSEWFDLSSDEMRKRDSENDAMRADYDADRAARVAAQPVAAPAQAGEYPALGKGSLWRDADGIHGYGADPGSGPWYTTEDVRRAIDADRAARGAAQAAPVDAAVQQDAERWQFFAEYLVSTRTDLDDEIVGCDSVQKMARVLDAARAAQKGGK